MKGSTWDAIDQKFAAFPFLRGSSAEWNEIDAASEIIGLAFPPDYREFLHRYGAAIVGAYPIFGLRQVEPMGTSWSVIEMNQHFKKTRWPGVDEWVLFSNDLAGSPYGLARDGSVWISDQEFGEITELYSDFEEFVRQQCLKMK